MYRLSPFGTFTGRSTSAFSTLNTTAFAPIPSASVIIAVRVNPGDLKSFRSVGFRSFGIMLLCTGAFYPRFRKSLYPRSQTKAHPALRHSTTRPQPLAVSLCCLLPNAYPLAPLSLVLRPCTASPVLRDNNLSRMTSQRTPEPPFTDVPGALDEILAGRMLVVVDDEDRENEGDLTLAAEHVTPEAINFMARYGRGLICLTLTEERADHMRLFPMTQQNSSRFGTAFTETIEAREGVTTGISAADRAHTIRVAIDPKSTASDLARPGHIFPLRARRGGVLVRAGQTEASVDLARMAGLTHAGVICEIMRDDGEMARIPDLIPFCQERGLRILTVAELIRYRLRHERYIVRAGETRIHTRYGEFRMIAYESEVNGGESHI